MLDDAYTAIVQTKCATLRPILKLARKNDTYRGKCKLEGDSLIITGTKYMVDTLRQTARRSSTLQGSSKNIPK